jgi:hypothetical protein
VLKHLWAPKKFKSFGQKVSAHRKFHKNGTFLTKRCPHNTTPPVDPSNARVGDEKGGIKELERKAGGALKTQQILLPTGWLPSMVIPSNPNPQSHQIRRLIVL